jgi:thiamine-monophosphate kinase
MPSETAFIALMRAIATDPAARGLRDDVATLAIGNETLVITHDMMVEGVHWLTDADPADVAWKLVAVNLSDLAAKGAAPAGLIMGYMLGDGDWDQRFAKGLAEALSHYQVPLLGGDTVGRGDEESARAIGMTAFGRVQNTLVPNRSAARAGDILYVTGTLGDASAGFDCINEGLTAPESLITAFNRPKAMLGEGQQLAPHVSAMMDISDGLLLDAARMAEASGLSIAIDLDTVPLSQDYIAMRGDSEVSRIAAASWGDDYQLLFAAAAGAALPIAATAVGRFADGSGLTLRYHDEPVPLPASLGFEHR